MTEPPGSRVLVIGLDGLEITYAEQLMAAGRLPHLAALRDRSAAFLLDNPPERRTGLEWEEFAAGLPPERFGRDSPIAFDPDSYTVIQEGARYETFLGRLDARTVVFDTPYIDLTAAASLRGVVAWGAHDPGTAAASRPADLVDRIGPYPSSHATYGLPWPSAERCRTMAEDLVVGLDARGRATVGLMTEFTADWEVFVVVSGEMHSATEALWHGVDEDHPLHDHASSDAAHEALDLVHEALDRFVGTVLDAAGPEVTTVAFNMGGMGLNGSDLPTMVLLPELLHRWSLGAPRLRTRPEWSTTSTPPLLGPDEAWERAVLGLLPATGRARALVDVGRRLPDPVRDALRRLRRRRRPSSGATSATKSVDWMPAARYTTVWPAMDAFALPAFYQGRIRVNLQGRERHGRVPPDRLDAVLDDLEALLTACRDPRTGEPVVAGFERPEAADPRRVRAEHADLIVAWQGMPTAIHHPEYGLIGPVPYRRTGGHSGPHGFCFVAGPGIGAHGYEHRSAFDVAPTVAALAGTRLGAGQPLVVPGAGAP